MQVDDPFTAPLSVVADPSGSSGTVSPGVVEILRRTKGWVRFLGILGLVGAALMLLFAVLVGITSLGNAMFAGAPGSGALAIGYAVFLGLMSLLYVVPCLRLLRYARGIDRLEQWRDAGRLEEALDQQRAFWRFAGIVAIALLVLYAMVFVGAIGFGVMTAMRGAA